MRPQRHMPPRSDTIEQNLLALRFIGDLAANTDVSDDLNDAGEVAEKKSPPLVSPARNVSLMRLPDGATV